MSIATGFASFRGTLGFTAAVAPFLCAALAIAQTAPAPTAPAPAAPTQPRPAPPRPAQPAAPSLPAPTAQPAAPLGAQPQSAGPVIVQLKPEPSQADWTKVCGKDQGASAEICFTTRDFVSDQGQPVLSVAAYEIKTAQPQKIFRFVIPPGLLLQPGIRFAVDQGQATAGRFVLCLANGCFAEAPVKDDVINALKKGTTLNVSVQNQAGREVTFSVPAAGFGKIFDGPPIDPKVLEEQQKRLQEELEKKSEELRKRLEQQTSAAGAAPAPAPPTPAPAAAPRPAAPMAPAPGAVAPVAPRPGAPAAPRP